MMPWSKQGREERLNLDSYLKQGIAQEPGQHAGPGGWKAILKHTYMLKNILRSYRTPEEKPAPVPVLETENAIEAGSETNDPHERFHNAALRGYVKHTNFAEAEVTQGFVSRMQQMTGSVIDKAKDVGRTIADQFRSASWVDWVTQKPDDPEKDNPENKAPEMGR